jgi:small basic protein (TIGR04137 family)
MSIHSSLRSRTGATETLKNVLKRHERVRLLMDQGKWADGRSMFGLPKIKPAKIKAAKKAAKAEGEKKEVAEASTAAPAPAGTKSAAKPAAKAPAGK